MGNSAGVMECWSIAKYQIPSTKSHGVRFQVSGKRNTEAETYWSEAEIPSEAE
jgi:hypothetical protein